MKKILALGGSNSYDSINRIFALYTAGLFTDVEIVGYDLSTIDIPLYSKQLEENIGLPEAVANFAKQIDEIDFIVLSLAENNGNFNAGFKNLMDWTSRIEGRKIFGQKPMLLLATSPGGRGGASVLELANKLFPFHGALIQDSFSLPKFDENFDNEKGITNPELLQKLKTIIQSINSEQWKSA